MRIRSASGAAAARRTNCSSSSITGWELERASAGSTGVDLLGVGEGRTLGHAAPQLLAGRCVSGTVEQESDEVLMLQVASGDKRAFAVLFDRHAASVVRFAHRFVGDRGRAEELAQDVFVKLFRSARGYRPSARFKTYLFRVAANHCLNEVRRGEYHMSKSRHPDRGGEAPPLEPAAPEAESPDQALWGKQLEGAVGEALSQLSERERAAFCMCRFEGLAYRDIAEALSASEAAVKSLIHRATLTVARRIEEFKSGAVPQRSRA